MKIIGYILFAIILFPFFAHTQQGSTCANAIPLTLDGVCRTYATSITTADAVLCTSYPSNTPVTFFSFTTNATPDRVLIKITAPTGTACEVLMYSGSLCSSVLSSSSMCFDDGAGIWAPAHSYHQFMTPNTTYKIRVKTSTAGNIAVCAQHYTPVNDNCDGAMNIGPSPVPDNNACHTAGPGVTATQLCGTTLENTAFYRYTVANTGVSIININNIECDNGPANNSSGMQIGFFTGSCGTLTPISCYSDAGSFVSAITSSLPAGTNVYVAIDGVAGANCSYEISAFNAVVLTAELKNFIAWKKQSSNLITWTTLREFNNHYFEVEKSVNGTDFFAIARINGQRESNTDFHYEYEDFNPLKRSYYRLKQTSFAGKVKYFNTIQVLRAEGSTVKMNFQNPVQSQLSVSFDSETTEAYKLRIISSSGKILKEETIHFQSGINTFQKDVSFLSSGIYILEVSSPEFRLAKTFIKNTSFK